MKVMATYGEHEFFILLDTGATVTIIPNEYVKPEDITELPYAPSAPMQLR